MADAYALEDNGSRPLFFQDAGCVVAFPSCLGTAA